MSRLITSIQLALWLLFTLKIVDDHKTNAATIPEDTITLKCDEFERHYESVNGEMFCTVTGFMVSHSQNVKIQRYPKANMTKFMKFYDSRLLYVPFKLFDVFSSLKTLDVSFTEIVDVPRNTFGSASNLSFLNMSNNNISFLTNSAFMGAGNLVRLDLSRNNISKLTELALRGMPILDKIQLSHNRLIQIDKDVFLENIYVEVIVLDNNLLEYIEPEVFNRLRRVREVNLSFNRLIRFESNTFQAAYTLENLYLSANKLQQFQLTNKSILNSLHVDRNNLTTLTINGTKNVRADHNRIASIEMINSIALESLELAANNISNIANITNVTALIQLDLSFNPLGEIKINTFNRLKRLRILSLRAVGLRSLSFGMFSRQQNLETLDLAFNNLSEVNLDIFVPHLAHLKQFFIDGNNLTEIQGKRPLATAFPNLIKLGVSRNRFNCSYLHWLLVPPNLEPAVSLNIERDDSDVETTHIRDVSCISETKTNLQHAQHDLRTLSEIQRMMRESIDRMEVYLLLLKIALLVIICLLLGVIMVRLWKARRVTYLAMRSGSIVFHSNATVGGNNNVE